MKALSTSRSAIRGPASRQRISRTSLTGSIRDGGKEKTEWLEQALGSHWPKKWLKRTAEQSPLTSRQEKEQQWNSSCRSHRGTTGESSNSHCMHFDPVLERRAQCLRSATRSAE